MNKARLNLIASVLNCVKSELRDGNGTIWAENVRDAARFVDDELRTEPVSRDTVIEECARVVPDDMWSDISSQQVRDAIRALKGSSAAPEAAAKWEPLPSDLDTFYMMNASPGSVVYARRDSDHQLFRMTLPPLPQDGER